MKRLLALPIAFLLHDLEELFTVRRWMEANPHRVAPFIRDNVPLDNATLLEAFAVFFGVYLLAVIALLRNPRSRAAGVILAVLIMARLTNGVAHVAQGIVFSGYTPGLITAIVLEIPVAVYAVRELEKRGVT